MSNTSDKEIEIPHQYIFSQFLSFKVDAAWRRLEQKQREAGRREFSAIAAEYEKTIATYAYSTIGFRADADFFIWRKGLDPIFMQEMTARLLQTGLGGYCNPAHSFFGFARQSTYTKRFTSQEQAIEEENRSAYLVVYPFSKTTDWYLMSKEARQGMMNEHIRVGHSYADIPQVLLYATGLDDQEFIVAYETDDLPHFQSLVIDLRSTEARRYTLKDTPILTGVHRSIEATLELLG